MLLRSSAQTQAKQHPSIKTGDFIELRTYDSISRPWLARVVGERNVVQQSGEMSTEIECEWLWNPRDAILELELLDVDADVYGSREFLLTDEECESVRDWNPLDSVKWEVYVFPLPEYKKLVSCQYKIPSPKNASQLITLDPSRCWYYRQKCNPEKRFLKPPLDLTIHCPNPAFLEWCKVENVSPKTPTPLDLSSGATNPPRRSICIPENPERLYFLCSVCKRRFETPQGDCFFQDQSIASETRDIELNNTSRFKSSINQPDITFVCPMCTYSRELAGEISNNISETKNQPGLTDIRNESNRKATRYERFHEVFQRAIAECDNLNGESSLKYTDSHVLCTDFFQRFDEYTQRQKLNAKMIHQKLHEIFQNLKRDNNSALRRRIVVGSLSLDNLLDSDAKELAPESVKRRREIEAQKYFKQQVLLDNHTSRSKLMRKTHKGLEPIQDESEIFFLPHASHDSEAQIPSGVSQKERDAITLSLSSNDFSQESKNASIQEILQKVRENMAQKHHDYAELISLPHSLYTSWKQISCFPQSFQLKPPPEFTGIPSREQTFHFLKTRFAEVPGSLGIFDSLKSYSQLN